MDGERVQIKVDGMTFYVVGSDDSEYVKSLATELNEKLEQIYKRNYHLNQTQGLILTALNILDERESIQAQMETAAKAGEDSKVAYETVEELNRTKDKLKRTSQEFKQVSDVNEQLSAKVKELQHALKRYEQKNVDLEEKINVYERREEELKQSLEDAREKSYQAQLEVADLNKEISVLREEG